MHTLVGIEMESGFSVMVEAPIRVAGNLSSLVTDAGKALDLEDLAEGDWALLIDPATGEASAAVERAADGLRVARAGVDRAAVYAATLRWPEFVLMAPWHARLVDSDGRITESWGAATEAEANSIAALRLADHDVGRPRRLRAEVERHPTAPREELLELLGVAAAGPRP